MLSVTEGFLWGTAFSAQQSEGNNVKSDAWICENVQPTRYREPSGDACDSYNRWREDLEIAAGLGLNCYRFGIEWSRIEPEPGRFSLAELDRYRRILENAHAPGLKRSEERTSELQSLMRLSYAVFCFKKKNIHRIEHHNALTQYTH